MGCGGFRGVRSSVEPDPMPCDGDRRAYAALCRIRAYTSTKRKVALHESACDSRRFLIRRLSDVYGR